jgi:hypothetical protein
MPYQVVINTLAGFLRGIAAEEGVKAGTVIWYLSAERHAAELIFFNIATLLATWWTLRGQSFDALDLGKDKKNDLPWALKVYK